LVLLLLLSLDFSDAFVVLYIYLNKTKLSERGIKLNIVEFLEIVGISYEKFSKDKSKWLNKWQLWEPSFYIYGTGRTASVSAKSFEVFYFRQHAIDSWKITGMIDYSLLFKLYNIVIDRDGAYLRSYKVLSSQLGVHSNTISKYINLLDTAGIISKQVRYEGPNLRRVKALPMFHEEFKESLLEGLPPETDWYDHQF
jgi:hypothetical protein